MKVLPMLSFVTAAGLGVMWWASENDIRLPDGISTPLLVSQATIPEDPPGTPPGRLTLADARPLASTSSSSTAPSASTTLKGTKSSSAIEMELATDSPSVSLGESEPILMALSKPLPAESELHSVFSDPAAAPYSPSSKPSTRPKTKSAPRRFSSQPADSTAGEAASNPPATFGDSIEATEQATEQTIETEKPVVTQKQSTPATRESETVTRPVSDEEKLLGRWEIAYQSTDGLPIYIRTMGRGKFSTLVVAGLEGTDRISVRWADKLVTSISKSPNILNSSTITIVRAANPDGLQANRRTNSRDVDLNRNFPTANFSRGQTKRSGEAPASEIETRAILQTIATHQPNRVVILRSTPTRNGEVIHSMNAKNIANQLMTTSRWTPQLLLAPDWPGSLEVLADETVAAQVLSLSLPYGQDPMVEFDRHVNGLMIAISDQAGESLSPMARKQNYQQLENLMAQSARSRVAPADPVEAPNLDKYKLKQGGIPTSSPQGPAPVGKPRGYQELPPPPPSKT